MTKKLAVFLVLVGLAYAVSRTFAPDAVVAQKVGPHPANPAPAAITATATTATAPAVSGAATFDARDSGSVLQGAGTVTRLLSDDNDGSRHQRFILRLPSGQTVLVAHNIDLAPRLDGLAVGDTVEFKGEYAANSQGGVVHWTHRDPQGRHADGWLRYRGREYR